MHVLCTMHDAIVHRMHTAQCVELRCAQSSRWFCSG